MLRVKGGTAACMYDCVQHTRSCPAPRGTATLRLVCPGPRFITKSLLRNFTNTAANEQAATADRLWDAVERVVEAKYGIPLSIRAVIRSPDQGRSRAKQGRLSLNIDFPVLTVPHHPRSPPGRTKLARAANGKPQPQQQLKNNEPRRIPTNECSRKPTTLLYVCIQSTHTRYSVHAPRRAF